MFLAILFHAIINVSFSLFPNQISHCDPVPVDAVLIAMVGLLAVTRQLEDSQA